LTVGKYGKIKAVESALHQFFDIFRNFLLWIGVIVKDLIEFVAFLLINE
jgi:hypothetical protein